MDYFDVVLLLSFITLIAFTVWWTYKLNWRHQEEGKIECVLEASSGSLVYFSVGEIIYAPQITSRELKKEDRIIVEVNGFGGSPRIILPEVDEMDEH